MSNYVQVSDNGLIRQVTLQNNIWARAGLSAEETLPKETVERQEDASQIPVTQTTEDRPMATEVVAIEEAETNSEAEEISITDSVAQELPDNNETAESTDEIATSEKFET